jgi:hypothetical protein
MGYAVPASFDAAVARAKEYATFAERLWQMDDHVEALRMMDKAVEEMKAAKVSLENEKARPSWV